MRQNPFLFIILGYTGTGKTTYSKQIIEKYVENRDRILIVTPHDIEFNEFEQIDVTDTGFYKFSGVRRHIADADSLALIGDNKNHFRNGLLILDDARHFIDSRVSRELHQLLISRKQRGLDIIAAAHGFTEVPPKLFTFCSHILLFKTADNINMRKNVIRNFEHLKEAQQRINDHSDFHYHEIFKMI